MTLDEAIKHCLEAAKRNEMMAKFQPRMDYYDELESSEDCLERASEQRQLAKWLTKLKEAERLLKAAVEDFSSIYDHIFDCDVMCDTCPIRDNCDKWVHADEALALIREDDEQNDRKGEIRDERTHKKEES